MRKQDIIPQVFYGKENIREKRTLIADLETYIKTVMPNHPKKQQVIAGILGGSVKNGYLKRIGDYFICMR